MQPSARSRVRFIAGVAAAASLMPLSAFAADAPWPSRPITFIVSYPPGGGADLIGRLLAERMGPLLGQTIVVDNRGGGGGQIGAQAVARAAPDGYTVLVDAGGYAINPSLQPKLAYNPAKDFTAIGVVALFPHVVLVTPGLKVGSVAELVQASKKTPLFFASSGNGSSQHIAGVLFSQKAGVPMTHVPYKGGGPAMADVMGGQVPVFVGNIASTLSLIKAGKLKALAISGAARVPAIPEVPTLQELGIQGAEMYEWNGVFVPAGTPPAIVDKLSQAMEKALASPEVKARITALGGQMFQGGREQAAKFVASETQRMAEVIHANNIRPD